MIERMRMIATGLLAAGAVLGLATPASGYIGPGAGGGSSGGMGLGCVIAILIAGACVLCVLCGLIALFLTARDRLKSWTAAGRNDQAGPAGIDPTQS